MSEQLRPMTTLQGVFLNVSFKLLPMAFNDTIREERAPEARAEEIHLRGAYVPASKSPL